MISHKNSKNGKVVVGYYAGIFRELVVLPLKNNFSNSEGSCNEMIEFLEEMNGLSSRDWLRR